MRCIFVFYRNPCIRELVTLAGGFNGGVLALLSIKDPEGSSVRSC